MILVGPLGAQVQTDGSSQAAAPISKETLPKVKTTDPYLAHRRHSFYFADTLASVLLKFTMSPGFNAKDPSSLNDLGYIYYYFGEFADAQIQFKKALEINPAFSDAYVNLGVTAYKSGDFQAALQYLNRAYEMDSARGEIPYDLGLLSFEQGEFGRAAGFFLEAAQKIPDDPKVWNNLGCAYFKQKDYAKAYGAFQASVERGAAFYHAYYNLAVASILSGNYESAIAHTQKAVQLAPSNPDAANLLGLAYLFNQSYLKASVALARAVQKEPNHSGFLNNLGRAQLGLGHFKEAEKVLQRALLFDPGLKPAQWNMGDLKLRQGKVQEALTLYENVADWEEAKHNPVFQYNWGVACFQSGDREMARQHWETAKDLDPRYVEPIYGLAVLRQESRDFEKALALIRQGQSLEPQSSRWVRLEGDVEMGQGKQKEALASYEKARKMGQEDAGLLVKIEQLRNQNEQAEAKLSPTPEGPKAQVEPEKPSGYQDQIHHSVSIGNLDEALALAQKETGEWPAKSSSWEDLSGVYQKMNEREKAYQAMKRAQELFPKNQRLMEEAGQAAFLAGRYLIARDYFNQALMISPSFASSLGLGACAFKLNQFEESVQCWEKGLADFPNRAEFYYNLSRAHYELGHSAQASLYLQKALRLKPDYPEAITNSAGMDLDRDDLKAAEMKLKKSLALDPQVAETYFNFGNLELKKGALAEAMGYYQKGLELNPDDADAYYYQAVILLKQGQWTKAQNLLEKALEKNPAHANALYNLGKVAIETDDYSGARNYFEESLKYMPGQADAYFGLGLVHLHQGHYPQAQDNFEKAQASPRTRAEATYYLGQVSEKMGDKQAAAVLYLQSIQMSPGLGFPHLALGDILREQGQVHQARTEYEKASAQMEYPEIAKLAQKHLEELK